MQHRVVDRRADVVGHEAIVVELRAAMYEALLVDVPRALALDLLFKLPYGP